MKILFKSSSRIVLASEKNDLTRTLTIAAIDFHTHWFEGELADWEKTNEACSDWLAQVMWHYCILVIISKKYLKQ